MFEDSTFESSGSINKANKSKYWMMVTFITNGSILVLLILIPLIYPEALPKTMMLTVLTAPPTPPPPPPPPPPPEIVHVVKVQSEMMNNQLVAPTKIPKDIKQVSEKEAPPSQGFGVAGMEGLGGSAGGKALQRLDVPGARPPGAGVFRKVVHCLRGSAWHQRYCSGTRETHLWYRFEAGNIRGSRGV